MSAWTARGPPDTQAAVARIRRQSSSWTSSDTSVSILSFAIRTNFRLSNDLRLAGCWKTLRTHRMLKNASVLTRPTPARQDALFRGQGRSERRGEEVRTALRVRPFALTTGLGERKSLSSVSHIRETQC